MPLLGETEVKGVWSVAAVWIKEAAGIARAVAEWATEGYSEIDLHGADISRFYAHQRPAGTSTRAPTRATTAPTGSSTRWSSGSRTARFG